MGRLIYASLVVLAACGGSTPTARVPLSDSEPVVVPDSDYTTTDSGVKFFDIRVGTGQQFTIGATVVVD